MAVDCCGRRADFVANRRSLVITEARRGGTDNTTERLGPSIPKSGPTGLMQTRVGGGRVGIQFLGAALGAPQRQVSDGLAAPEHRRGAEDRLFAKAQSSGRRSASHPLTLENDPEKLDRHQALDLDGTKQAPDTGGFVDCQALPFTDDDHGRARSRPTRSEHRPPPNRSADRRLADFTGKRRKTVCVCLVRAGSDDDGGELTLRARPSLGFFFCATRTLVLWRLVRGEGGNVERLGIVLRPALVDVG